MAWARCTANDYVLSFSAARRKLTNTADGTSVTPAGAGTVASPYTAAGVSIVLSGVPANGDQFLVQPTATAAGSLNVVLSNPSQIAAAGAIKTAAAGTNTGAAIISSGTVLDIDQPEFAHACHHRFHQSDHLHHQRRRAQRLHQRRQHRR